MEGIAYLMSVKETSFEELRMQDYLAAYKTTGRPPQPCPTSPDTPQARAALGLPPLFVPTAITAPTENIPASHEFRQTKTPFGEWFESISAQPLYASLSHEELRYHAYLAGNKSPPRPSTMHGDPVGPSPVYPFYANDARSTAYLTSTAVAGTPDYFMSIVAAPKFEKHSFEELRIAFHLAGKEVGSSEIPTRGALPAQPAPTLFGRPRGDAFSSGSLKLF